MAELAICVDVAVELDAIDDEVAEDEAAVMDELSAAVVDVGDLLEVELEAIAVDEEWDVCVVVLVLLPLPETTK